MKLGFSELLRSPIIGVNCYKVTEICLRNVTVSKRDVVLDIGCGAGHLEFLLSKRVSRITGCDISESLIKFHNQNRKPNNVEFLCLDATREPPQEMLGMFDKVICMDVMEHVESPVALLEFVAKVLRDGGSGVITFPINNIHHGRNYFTKQAVYELVSNTPKEIDIKYLRRGKRWLLVNRLYVTARRLLGKHEKDTDNFGHSVWFSMMQNPSRIFLLYKLGLTLLNKFSEGSFYEDESGDRALFRIRKRAFAGDKKVG